MYVDMHAYIFMKRNMKLLLIRTISVLDLLKYKITKETYYDLYTVKVPK